ncbi:hypothetical protein D3C72_2161840 [compost metagenome]
MAESGLPPSPVLPEAPVPATIVSIPPVLILATWWLAESLKYRTPSPSTQSPLGLLRLTAVAGPFERVPAVRVPA